MNQFSHKAIFCLIFLFLTEDNDTSYTGHKEKRAKVTKHFVHF